MKLASISVVTVSLLVCVAGVGVAAGGCSSGRSHPTSDTGVRHIDSGPISIPDVGPRVDTGTITPHDSGTITPPHDAGGTGHDAGGSACTATCTSDSVCTAMCGAVPGGGIRCCDHSTSRCFVSHTASCPAAGTDSGSGMTY